jgi:AraC-like DNA-binding protein
MIAHTDGGSDDLLLFCPCSRWHLEFSDRHSEINQRTLLLVNDRDKIISRTMEPVDQIALRIPRDVLERRIPITGTVTNQPIAAQGDAALLAGFIREIVHVGPSALSPAVAMLVREQMLDLAAVALGNLAGVTPKLGATTRFVTLKLRAAIESQLTDPNADRQSIAAAAGISERHANRLLAQQGTSVRRLLMERRLAKCREAFEDRMQLGRSISDIAFAFGFRDLSHFNHAFKNRYGLAPREYRITFWSDGTLMSRGDK